MDSLFPNLRATMKQRGVSIKMLADVIGRSEEIVHLKMRGVQEWTLKEALEICRYLQCSDFKSLFLR
jgi:DNA-binding Xre family transcriptional regulator